MIQNLNIEKRTALLKIAERILIAGALILLCVSIICYKFYQLNKLPFFNPQDGEAFFWTESAFHFRHFLMVVSGRGIPALDVGIQFPEGLNTVKYITPVMEYMYGTLYRLFFKDVAPHVFLTGATFIFSTISVIAVFAAGRMVWRSKLAGIACAAFYTFSPASFTRNAGGGFIREDFALPFIFFSFACFLYCMKKDRLPVSVAGSTLLVIALASWHVTQLYLAVFVVGLAVIYFLNGREGLPKKSISMFIAVVTAAALFLPVLRAKSFVLSPAMMISYALLVCLWIPAVGKSRARGGALIAVFFVFALVMQNLTGSYSHVYGLIIDKIRFLGNLPLDPVLMSFESKSMWTSAFVSPKMIELPILLSFALIFGPLGVLTTAYRYFKKKAVSGEILVAYFTVCTFVLFLMIHRISVFAIFFLSLSMGSLMVFDRKIYKNIVFGFLGICFLFQISLLEGFKLQAFRPAHNDVKGLLSFIREYTPEDAAVLTLFQAGPMVAAYADRPVVLHSKFESKLLRDKVEKVYRGFFGKEEEFSGICEEYKADIVVYQPNIVIASGPGSIQHLVGTTRVRSDSVAFLFHFAPEKLKQFRLIYQNPTYRVFSTAASGIERSRKIKYEPIYDPEIFFDTSQVRETIGGEEMETGLARFSDPGTYGEMGDRFSEQGDQGTAAELYERAFFMTGADSPYIWPLGTTLIKAGNRQKGIAVLREALRMHSDFDVTYLDIKDAEIWMILGSDEAMRRKYDRAETLFTKAIEKDPYLKGIYFAFGMAFFSQNKIEEAKEMLERSIDFEPDNYQAYEVLGKIAAASGNYEKAVEYVENSLAANPNQPQLRNIRNQLKAMIEKQKGDVPLGDTPQS